MLLSEMEEHHEKLLRIESSVTEMERRSEFPAVFSTCLDVVQHIVPAMGFRKKRSLSPETPNLRSLAVLWKYGPPMFEHESLVAARNFIASTRKLAKHENAYLALAEAALKREEVARVLWNHIQHTSGARQSTLACELGLERDDTTSILDVWQSLRIIRREPDGRTHRLHLATRFDEVARGMCYTCGSRVRGPKELLLKPVPCKNCGTEDFFFIVPTSGDEPTRQ